MIGFNFDQLITQAGLDLSRCRLVRHDRRIAQYYRSDKSLYLHHISYQAAKTDPYHHANYAFQFLPGPVISNGDQTALFVGAHEIVEGWPYSEARLSPHHYLGEDYSWDDRPHSTYHLEAIEAFTPFVEAALIRWGSAASARAWSQWAHRQPKEILELRHQPVTPPFPGFLAFHSSFEEVALLPSEWVAILRHAQGVYLLTDPKTGEQYVGSAYGEDGFWGRWQHYAANGHGGNKLMRPKFGTNFQISILEIAASSMTAADIIARETLWKHKLGTRDHGLNEN